MKKRVLFISDFRGLDDFAHDVLSSITASSVVEIGKMWVNGPEKIQDNVQTKQPITTCKRKLSFATGPDFILSDHFFGSFFQNMNQGTQKSIHKIR